MTKFKSIAVLGVVLSFSMILFTGCSKKYLLDQSNFCVIHDLSWESLQKCKPGTIVFFAPQTWGNDQYPLTAVYLFADFNYPIVYNNGGVVCVFTDERIKKMSNSFK